MTDLCQMEEDIVAAACEFGCSTAHPSLSEVKSHIWRLLHRKS